ncbi:LAMI_0D04500g1_1 [Lachancea mirantina]|uniref:Altered inheritance of mitochondria protein 24, mitochondrial n=1 Tax=Lachancea mirantina TaxID=1230905 RepID=A0A1G4JAJ5_9SACH|nr:LAMI_0D04500g1_1 [Lachancea mirantina]
MLLKKLVSTRMFHISRIRRDVAVPQFSKKLNGSSAGPFIQLPQFTPFQDSMLVKMPSSCSIYTKLDKVSVVSVEPPETVGQTTETATGPVLFKSTTPNGSFLKLSTKQQSVNALLVSNTATSSVAVIQIEDYEKGWYLTNPRASIMCYSGDLSFPSENKVIGSGVIAMGGDGPIYRMQLNTDEHIYINPAAVLAFDKDIKLTVTNLSRKAAFISTSLLRFFSQDTVDASLLAWDKLADKSSIFCRVQGPGTILLQTAFTPGAHFTPSSK